MCEIVGANLCNEGEGATLAGAEGLLLGALLLGDPRTELRGAGWL